MTMSEKFHHPYEPYSIQADFMTALYEALDMSALGIFESPTGTGKTLSLICATLSWLRDHPSELIGNGAIHAGPKGLIKFNSKDETEFSADNEPAWILEEERKEHLRQASLRRRELTQKLVEARRTMKSRAQSVLRAENDAKRRKISPGKTEGNSEQDYLVDPYDSDGARETTKAKSTNYSPAVLRLLAASGHHPVKPKTVEIYPAERKIFFASRTHSQLSQFASELAKAPMPMLNLDDGSPTEDKHPARLIALASRKNLCINPIVSKLSVEALNETCLEMQDKKTPAEGRCRYFPATSDRSTQFGDQALAQIADIEDLVQLGKNLEVCPYYSSRVAVPPSEIVTLPYPLLLNKAAREALEIDLRGNIVVIDEAHNLIDAVNSISSACIRLADLERAQSGIQDYLQKFSTRLGGQNRMYIAQLERLLQSLLDLMTRTSTDREVTAADLQNRGVDAVNVFKITQYLRASKLARKIDAYTTSLKEETVDRVAKSTPVLTVIHSFLACLANPSPEGRFFIFTDESKQKNLQYLLLDPSHEFSDIVREARSVILAGGTMEPMTDFVNMLFPREAARVRMFSCGHIIPKDHMTALIMDSGPVAQRKFDFSFGTRNNGEMLQDLGQCIYNLIRVIPDGVIVFFGSYDYLAIVTRAWQATGMLDKMRRLKAIFEESRESKSDEVLQAHSDAVNRGTGSLLLAVVGGKISEGINFADSLGRAVIMVGIPYPNSHSVEWSARLTYCENATMRRSIEEGVRPEEARRRGKAAAKDYYENAAMRAVNQSIGRAIRHRGDYAAIILVDTRYQRIEIQKKLPKWIKDGLDETPLPFPRALSRVGAFFKGKRI